MSDIGSGTWTYDLTGYLIGGAAILYGLFSKRFKGRPTATGRIIWLIVGSLFILGNVAQNVIELRDH